MDLKFRTPLWFAIIISITIGVGCQKKATTPVTTPATNSLPASPTRPQPKLPTLKLYLGAQEINAEVAVSNEQMQAGMMFRTNIAENEGMIFVFPYPHQASFWMKNTLLPLSAAYIDADGVIQEIHDLEPHNTNSVKAASNNIHFVLETKQGWFQRNNVSVGALIRTEKGSLKKTFFR